MLQLLGPSTGGIRRHVVHLTAQLRRRGWLVAMAGPHGVLDGLAELDHAIEVPSSVTPAALSARSRLRALVAEADVVHAHGLKAGWLAASLRRRPPLMVTVHNLVLPEVSGPVTPLLRALEGGLAGRVDRLVAPSDEVARRFTGTVGGGRTIVVPPVWPAPVARHTAAEVRSRWGVATGASLVVTVARLHPQKGLDLLLDAVALLRRDGTDLRCLVLGEGPLEEELRRQIDRLGLAGVVTLAGSRRSVADELAAADVVVVPSRWESGPLVAFEALQLGRPLVSTAVGAVPRVVVDGVSGRVVPVGDASALAGAIDGMLDDPQGAARLAEGGRRAVSGRYDEAALLAAVEDLYRDLVEIRTRHQDGDRCEPLS